MKTATRTKAWSWDYSGIPCRLVRGSESMSGTIVVPAGHPWHGAAPPDCRLRGERIEIDGVLSDARPSGMDWAIEVAFDDLSPSDAAYELELLADAAAYLAKSGRAA